MTILRSFIALTALAVLGCSGDSAPSAGGKELTLAPHWVAPNQRSGAEQCADCHEDIVESWSETGMARTLGVVKPDLASQTGQAGELQGLGHVADGPDGYRYHFAESPDGQAFVLAETHSGDPGFAMGYEVLYGIGSGELDRSLAVAHGSKTWFAPVEVLTTGGGRKSVLSPGASMGHGARLTTPITNECLGCHTDALPPKTYPLNLTPNPRDWQPRGISCAACHGQGDAHVAWNESDANPEGADPMGSMGKLNRQQQLSICAACHLQGDARIVLNGVELGPPEPGGDLLEQRAVFVSANPGPEVGFVSQVERLSMSACFLQSEMTCSTCHDPHRSMQEPRERKLVRDACSKCHAPQEVHVGKAELASSALLEAGNDCVSCHMPFVGVFDVAEVQIHDHFIRRDIADAPSPTPSDQLRFPESASGDWKRFQWPGVAAPDHLDDAGLWLMAYAAGGHLQRAGELLDQSPGPASNALPMYHHVRGSLLTQFNRKTDAVASYRKALELDPELGSSAVNLGLLLGELGATEEGLEVLSRAIEQHPMADGAWRNRAVVKLSLGDQRGAAEDLGRAFQIAPTSELAMALARLYGDLKQTSQQARWLDLAQQLSPDLPLK
ncbi:MAG: hypothetical protein ACI9D0_001558 [Bacteroidia bacterium]|jgi:hypothetical protein